MKDKGYLQCLGYALVFIIAFFACTDNSSSPESTGDANSRNWIIPEDQLVGNSAGKGGIPSIDEPKFAPVSQVDFIPDNRRVVGIKIGESVKAYPHQILDWHEIVNDNVGDEAVAITYCPLTGTAIGWNRKVNGQITKFGVSSVLFRNNQIPFDQSTDSRWSQMQMRSVAGESVHTNIKTESIIETTWSTWKKMYPESMILTTETGFSRNYGSFAYGSTYSTNHSAILFPIFHPDNRLENKVRVHGVINSQPVNETSLARAYPIKNFGSGINIIHDRVGQKKIVVAGSSGLDFSVSFERVLDGGTELEFKSIQNQLPVIMTDQEGNRWDLFGYAVEGPRQGERLRPTLSYTGYWFAWADFFPNIEIYETEEQSL